MSKRKAYWDMTTEELAAATKEFDDPNHNLPVVKPSAAQKFHLRRWHRKARLRTKRNGPMPAQGLVDWLLACPAKGYFVPIDPESTDRL